MQEIEKDFDFDVSQEDFVIKKVWKTFIKPFLIDKAGLKCKLLRYENGEYEKILQLKGVDILATTSSGKILKFDCKAQTNGYIGINGEGPTPTFCCELDFLKDGKELPGWFLDVLKETTHLILIWIDDAKVKNVSRNTYRSSNDDNNLIDDENDIYAYRVMVVSIEKLWDWLNSYGCTKEKLEEAVRMLRGDVNLYRLHYDMRIRRIVKDKPNHKEWMSIVKTAYEVKEEEPINIVIKISQWMKIATFYCGVDENGVHVKVANGKTVIDKDNVPYRFEKKF